MRTGLLVGAWLVSALAGAAEVTETGGFTVGATEVVGYKLSQEGAPDVEYFISKTKEPAPLVLLIQGSGCAPVFSGLDTLRRSSNVFGYIDLAQQGKYAVMVVNKPYAPKDAPNGGGIIACPTEFNDYFTLENWVRDLGRAYDHAAQQPWVKAGSSLVLGVSEGATAAAGLAEKEGRVTDVAIVSGSGPSQYYDFVAGAYAAGGGDEEIKRRLDELEATRQKIAADPDNAKILAWGHPYRRWTSFFRASSTQSLLKSQARVYIVGGMKDTSVPIMSGEAMAAELLGAGHDVTMRRIPNAGHNLLPAGAAAGNMWPEYQRIVEWYARDLSKQ
ncbi:prolyl oligopeptidase family serine peptidase [Oxalobacteraceae bacterium OTU3CAMAD1]|nr:prolyl oligopeptidase family serine peptidase [Oxalobacteraceae bacterium OTU3CAMAD1]